jgi:hypothetical protein
MNASSDQALPTPVRAWLATARKATNLSDALLSAAGSLHGIEAYKFEMASIIGWIFPPSCSL